MWQLIHTEASEGSKTMTWEHGCMSVTFWHNFHSSCCMDKHMKFEVEQPTSKEPKAPVAFSWHHQGHARELSDGFSEGYGPLSVTSRRCGVDSGLRSCPSFIWKLREENNVNFPSPLVSIWTCSLILHVAFWQLSRPSLMLPAPCTCDWPHWTVPSAFKKIWIYLQ